MRHHHPVPSLATRLACCAVALLAGIADAAAHAAAMDVLPRATPSSWHAVDAAELDAARGGFQLSSGLAVGLGIERTVAINGELVTQTRFAIADMRTLSAEQAAQARDALSTVQLIQNGRIAGSDGPAAAWPGGSGATVIQNSLDNQRIDSRTVIDASVNTLGGLRTLNFSSSVLDSLTRGALPH